MRFYPQNVDRLYQQCEGGRKMKRLLLFLLAIIFLLSMTACGGYNGIMREHLSNEDNYYDVLKDYFASIISP